MRFPTTPAVALACAGVLLSCRNDRQPASTPSATSQPPERAAPAPTADSAPASVAVTATNYAFDLPAQLPAGAATLRLVNRGSELHHAQIVKLEEGKTGKDLLAALKTPGPPPAWVKFVGGPNAAAPGQETSAAASLAPGKYAMVCLIPSPDGTMHAAKGMVREFEVTGEEPSAAARLPEADVTVTLVDYDFRTSGPLAPGRHTILVENAGPQVHELVVLKLAPGKKVEDFAHWAESGMRGPPPAEPVGGIALLDKGGRGTFTVDLAPGEYGFICFVPDSKDGKPHLAHGMIKQVRVG
jgi:hypothetical protein